MTRAMTPRVKKLLAIADKIATDKGDMYLGCEHIIECLERLERTDTTWPYPKIFNAKQKLEPISEALAESIAEEIYSRIITAIPLQNSWHELKDKTKELLLKRLAKPEPINQIYAKAMLDSCQEHIAELKSQLASKNEKLNDYIEKHYQCHLNSESKSQWPSPRCLKSDPPKSEADVLILDNLGWYVVKWMRGCSVNRLQSEATHWLPAPPIPIAEKIAEKANLPTEEEIEAEVSRSIDVIKLFTPEQAQRLREAVLGVLAKAEPAAPIPSVKEEKYDYRKSVPKYQQEEKEASQPQAGEGDDLLDVMEHLKKAYALNGPDERIVTIEEHFRMDALNFMKHLAIRVQELEKAR